jgi:anti-sigma factor RsiW
MCEFKQQVHAYYDGELPTERAAQVEQHLLTCANCAAELEQLRAISNLLSRGPTIRPMTLARIHRSIDSLSEGVILKLVTRLTAAAALVLLAGTLWLISEAPEARAQDQIVAMPATWEHAAVALNADPSADVQFEHLVLADGTERASK